MGDANGATPAAGFSEKTRDLLARAQAERARAAGNIRTAREVCEAAARAVVRNKAAREALAGARAAVNRPVPTAPPDPPCRGS